MSHPIPDGATLLHDQDEQLLRQVPQALRPGGAMMSTAFTPSKSDAGLLSTLRERVGPDEAWRRYEQDLELQSDGTWAVTVGEAQAAYGLPSYDDAGVPDFPVDHASIDFRALSDGQAKKAGRKLKERALERGCLFSPEVAETLR